MAEKRSESQNKEESTELGRPFTPKKKMKTQELLEAMGQKLTEVIKTVNANTENSRTRFETIENNQTELTKIIASMRQSNPGLSSGSGAGSITGRERMVGGLIETILRGETPSAMDQAFKMAESFQKIYMTGQTNMLRMMQLMSKRSSVKKVLQPEEEGAGE